MLSCVDNDRIFKALADPSRRHLLDRLNARNGQSLLVIMQDGRVHKRTTYRSA